VTAVIVWLLINPHVFSPVGPETWCARRIYGEKLWLEGREGMPAGYRRMFRFLILPAAAGFILLGVGLVEPAFWPMLLGAVLIVLTQLWRIDRLGRLYDMTRCIESGRASREAS
jgi:hypothetical protein